MIEFKTGDIFKSKAQTLVNPVNLEGVMGDGLALAFKKRYPAMYPPYKRVCEQKSFYLGSLLLWRGPERWVLNFPTKIEWRKPSCPDIIGSGLQKFCMSYEKQGIHSVAFPMLGCEKGGLSWISQVRPLMEDFLGELPLHIEIYEQDGSDTP